MRTLQPHPLVARPDYIAGDPACLRTLLTEQVRVADLLAARR